MVTECPAAGWVSVPDKLFIKLNQLGTFVLDKKGLLKNNELHKSVWFGCLLDTQVFTSTSVSNTSVLHIVRAARF